MGTIIRQDLKSGGLCFNCGELANGEWVGQRLAIGVCKSCAIEILPRLIAYAVVEFASIDAIGDSPEDVEKSFSRFWEESQEHFSEIVELVLQTGR